MVERKKPVTAAIKTILLGYVLYVAGHGCYNLYSAGREKVNEAIEIGSTSKEYVEKKIEPIRDYIEPKQNEVKQNIPRIDATQNYQAQPKHLEKIVGE